jgi:hypothetical protein
MPLHLLHLLHFNSQRLEKIVRSDQMLSEANGLVWSLRASKEPHDQITKCMHVRACDKMRALRLDTGRIWESKSPIIAFK